MAHGWILIENGKPVITTNGAIIVFRTKNALFEYYAGALGDLNAIKRIDYIGFAHNLDIHSLILLS